MIQVTKLTGERYYINSELIETIEMIPDTLITMTNGKKHYVLENAGQVIDRIEAFKASILGSCYYGKAARLAASMTNREDASEPQDGAKDE